MDDDEEESGRDVAVAFDFGTGNGSPFTYPTVEKFIIGKSTRRHSSIPIINCNIEAVTQFRLQ